MENWVLNIAQLGPGLILGVILHEIAHGYIAYKWGDSTAHDSGRITLNPIPHIDPWMTLVIPALCMAMGGFLFGGAKPVPINPNRFRNYRKGLFWVALAGPAMNIIIALLASVCYAATLRFLPDSVSLKAPFAQIFFYTVMINYVLAFFNLLPIPPLDGGRILESVLSREAYEKIAPLEAYSFFIIMALIITGMFKILYIPVDAFTKFSLSLMLYLFGVQ